MMIGELKSLVATEYIKSSRTNCLLHTSGKSPSFILSEPYKGSLLHKQTDEYM